MNIEEMSNEELLYLIKRGDCETEQDNQGEIILSRFSQLEAENKELKEKVEFWSKNRSVQKILTSFNMYKSYTDICRPPCNGAITTSGLCSICGLPKG